jgi:hypothetical protein
VVKRFVALLMLAGGLLVAGVAGATTYIDTITSWDNTNSVGTFGAGGTPTYGQVITVGSGVDPITQFTFKIGTCSTAGNYLAYIYAWDGSKATGSALYTSTVQSIGSGTPITASSTFNVPSLSLAPGQYILFVSTDGVSSPVDGCSFGLVSPGAYSGGSFNFTYTGFTSAGWGSFSGDNLAFSVITSPASAPVPSLSEWAQLMLALMVMTVIGWHFHRERSS